MNCDFLNNPIGRKSVQSRSLIFTCIFAREKYIFIAYFGLPLLIINNDLSTQRSIE